MRRFGDAVLPFGTADTPSMALSIALVAVTHRVVAAVTTICVTTPATGPRLLLEGSVIWPPAAWSAPTRRFLDRQLGLHPTRRLIARWLGVAAQRLGGVVETITNGAQLSAGSTGEAGVMVKTLDITTNRLV